MANKEEISFVLNSNLDKIANHAKILSQNVEHLHKAFKRKNIALIEQNRLENIAVEGIKKLADNYSRLNDNVSGVINNNKKFVDSFSDSASNLSTITSIIDKLNNKIDDLNNNITDINRNTINIEFSTEKIEKYWKTFKKIGNFIHDIIKSLLHGIYKMGAQLAVEALNLKPFALEFMNTFSFNPLKFFGFGEAMKESFNLILKFQQMRHELAYLSDASGDASKALSLVYEIAGGSAIASGTAQGIIRALADQGVIANKELKSLGILSGNLQAATGIAASQWASFTGELSFNYGIPIKGLENITSALIGTNIRGAQLEKVMGTVNKALQTVGFIAGVPTTESIHKLTKSIGGASKTFQALGISAEKSGAFIEGIMDPENFEKNAFLFAKLGISAAEYGGYLNDVDGQQKLLQKTMENLPTLANEIANIQNPFARFQYAKTIGLDMQIVQRMAGKTKAEIEEMLADYEKENKAKEALEAKKQRMAAESAKFDDMMLALKLKVLAPVMNFLSSGYLDRFFAVLPKIAKTIGSIFKAMTPIIEEVTNAILNAMPYVTKLVNDWITPFIKMFPQILKGFLGLIGIKGIEIAPLPENASPEEIEKHNAERANNMYSMIGEVIKYLGIISAVLVGWKTFTFLGDMVGKVVGFFNPRSKKIINATVGELGDEIRRSTQPTPGDVNSLMGTALTVAQIAAAGVASYAAYKVTSGTVEKAGGTESISDRIGLKTGYNVFEKVAGEKGLELIKKSYEKTIEYSSKMIEKAGSKMGALSNWFVQGFSTVVGWGKGLISEFPRIKTFVEMIGKGTSKFTTFLGGSFSKFVNFASGSFSKFVGWGKGLISQIPGIKTFGEMIGKGTSKVFGGLGAKGALSAGLKTATSWKTLGAGYVGGLAGEGLANLMGRNKEVTEAAKNIGSFGTSTIAAAMIGGPVGAAVNMAIEGGLRGFAESEKINKLVKDKIGPSITDPLGEPNFLDNIANKLQGTIGGAVTLGLPFLFEDIATTWNNETASFGSTFVGTIGEKFVKPLRYAARAYEATAGEYEVIYNNFNQKFKMAAEEFNNNIKEGKYFEAFVSLGSMIFLKFKQYVITPLKQFLEGIFNSIIVMFADFQQYFSGTELGKKIWDSMFPDFIKMSKEKQKEQQYFKMLSNYQQQLFDGGLNVESFKTIIATNPILKNMLEKNSTFKQQYDDILNIIQQKNSNDQKTKKTSDDQLLELKKQTAIAQKQLNKDTKVEVKTTNVSDFINISSFGKAFAP